MQFRTPAWRRLFAASLFVLALLGAPFLSRSHLDSGSAAAIVADGPPGTAGDGNGRWHPA